MGPRAYEEILTNWQIVGSTRALLLLEDITVWHQFYDNWCCFLRHWVTALMPEQSNKLDSVDHVLVKRTTEHRKVWSGKIARSISCNRLCNVICLALSVWLLDWFSWSSPDMGMYSIRKHPSRSMAQNNPRLRSHRWSHPRQSIWPRKMRS